MGRAIATFLLSAILGVLDLVDAVYKGVFSLWARLAAFDTRKGRASSTGSRPPPPRVVGLILAEPDVSDISIRTVSRLTSWCLAYSSVQQVHLFDAAGHLKGCQQLLQDSISELAQQQGRTIELKSGWSAPLCNSAAFLSASPQQQQQPPGSSSLTAGLQGSRPPQTRTWSDWLSQTVTGSAKRPPAAPSLLSLQHKQQQQQQQAHRRQQQLHATQHHQQQQQAVASQCVQLELEQQQQQRSSLAVDQATAGEDVPLKDSSRSDQGFLQEAAAGCAAAAAVSDAAQPGQPAASAAAKTSTADAATVPGPIAAAAAAAGKRAGSKSARDAQHHSSSSSSRSRRAVVVRLLSAEDAFAPVIHSILDRCSAAAGAGCLSPRAPSPAAPRQLFGPASSGSSSSKASRRSAADRAAGEPVPGSSDTEQQLEAAVVGGACSGCAAAAAAAAAHADAAAAVAAHADAAGAASDIGAGTCTCDQNSCQQPARLLAGGSSSSSRHKAAAASSSKKTVLQVIYDNTTAAAAVVADAISTTTIGLTSSSGQMQQQQQQKLCSTADKQRQQRGMLQDIAAATGQEDILQEPQLLLVFGSVLTLAGYPPFHTRVAEVQHLGRLAGVQQGDVDAAFAGFCRVLQRHGA